MNESIKYHIKNIWDYHNIPNCQKKSEFILVMGSADDRVAYHAAYLYHMGYSKLFITSGGVGKVTKEIYTQSEGERFAQILISCKIPTECIIIEDKASNTGENLQFSKSRLIEKNLNFTNGLLVTKPYMKRRAYATAMKQWPEINWEVSAPLISIDMYPDNKISMDMMVNLMVGDLQRIAEYAKLGFQIEQEIPSNVWESYNYLVEKGFNKYVIK